MLFTLSSLCMAKSLRAYVLTPRIGKRSFAGTTSEPRKSDTVRAVCKSNPEHGARPGAVPYPGIRQPPRCPSIFRVPPPPPPPGKHERGRARTCLMYKRQNAPGRSIPIISLWPGRDRSYCGIAVLPYSTRPVRTERA